MVGSDQEDGNQKRSLHHQTPLDIQRITFHPSDLPIGPILGPLHDAEYAGDDDEDFVENLKRQLFADTPPRPRSSSDESSILNEITMASSQTNDQGMPTTATTTITTVAVGQQPQQQNVDLLAAVSATTNVAALHNMNVTTTASTTKRQRRPCFSYAKKLICADRSMYFNPNPSFPLPDSTPELLGQVIACPTKKNNYNFEISWIRPQSGQQWPPNLCHHLCTFFHQNRYQALITSLISGCALNDDNYKPFIMRSDIPTLLPAPRQNPSAAQHQAVLPQQEQPEQP